MIEFFKNISAINSSIISIIFAFILNKVFGFQEKIDNLSENINSKIQELEELKIEIKNIGIKRGKINDTLKEIKSKYFENYLEYTKAPAYNIKKLIKENRAFFLTLTEVLEEIEEEEKQFLEEEKKKLYDYIVEKVEFNSIEDLKEKMKKNPYYEILVNKKIILDSNFEGIFMELKGRKASSLLRNPFEKLSDMFSKYEYESLLEPSILDTSEIEKKLELYCFKLEKLEKENKRIKFLEREVSFLKKFLYGLYLFFIFGVIYPMSYVKYGNEIILDYSLYHNFIEELTSMSGIFLGVLTIFVSSFFFILIRMLKIDISTETLKEVDKDEDWILYNYLEYITY